MQVLAATLLYAAYSVAVTWPVVTDLDGSIFGALPGDLTGAIAHTREVVEERLFPFAPATLTDFNAPDGLEEQWVLNLATLPGTGMLYGMSFVFGAIAGHTLFTLLGYTLSGAAMFVLARRVTGSAPAALVAGFAFAFHPFAIAKGEGHLHFVHGWPIVLMLWRMLEVVEAPTRRNGLWAGAATALAMWFTPYYVLIAGVGFAAAALVALLLGWSRGTLGAHVRSIAWASAVVVALVASLGALQLLAGGGEAGGLRTQSLSELTVYSARLHEFVVPDRDNLLVETGPFLEARLHGSNFSENSLYLGLSVLALALVAAGALAGGLRRSWRAALADRIGAGTAMGGVIALVAVAFSAPPQITVGGTLVPAPAWFVYQLTSTWRVYSRFVVLVMAGVALLAAVGVARLLVRRSPRAAGAITALLLVVVAVDLWARPKGVVTTPGVPAVYTALREQPPGGVAEYPIQPGSLPDATAIWFQQAHGKPILNGFPAGTDDESRKIELNELADRETAGDLAAFGMRYVLVRSNYQGGRPGRGFQRIHTGPEGEAFRITAAPSTAGVDALGAEWGLPEGAPNGRFRWMGYDGARILVWCDQGLCDGELSFETTSWAEPRDLEIRDSGGKVVHRQRIGIESTQVRVPLRFERGIELAFHTTPDPAQVPIAPGSTETRPLGISLVEPRFALR